MANSREDLTDIANLLDKASDNNLLAEVVLSALQIANEHQFDPVQALIAGLEDWDCA